MVAIGEKTRPRRGRPPGAFVTAAGVPVHYVRAATGRPVVYIHGAKSSVYDFLLSIGDDGVRPLHRRRLRPARAPASAAACDEADGGTAAGAGGRAAGGRRGARARAPRAGRPLLRRRRRAGLGARRARRRWPPSSPSAATSCRWARRRPWVDVAGPLARRRAARSGAGRAHVVRRPLVDVRCGASSSRTRCRPTTCASRRRSRSTPRRLRQRRRRAARAGRAGLRALERAVPRAAVPGRHRRGRAGPGGAAAPSSLRLHRLAARVRARVLAGDRAHAALRAARRRARRHRPGARSSPT